MRSCGRSRQARREHLVHQDGERRRSVRGRRGHLCLVARPDLADEPTAAFVDDFARTLSRTDKVQPTLLIVAIVASVGVVVTHAGLSRVLALVGAVGFLVVLIASLAVLVPLQRRIISSPDSEALGEMRERWFGGNLARSTLSVIAFVATAIAASAA
jgi:hypothetical protein